jgi:hypothetical protein
MIRIVLIWLSLSPASFSSWSSAVEGQKGVRAQTVGEPGRATLRSDTGWSLLKGVPMRFAISLLVLILVAATAVAAADKGKTWSDPTSGARQNLDCSNALYLGCDDWVSGDNTAAPSNVSSYPCIYWNESGGEVVYEITLPEPHCHSLSIELDPQGCDLDVFLLGSCDENDCLDYGDDFIRAGCLEPGTYYVVVDGRDGAECGYYLSTFCNVCDCPEEPCCPFDNVCYFADYNDSPAGAFTLPCGGVENVWYWGPATPGVPDVACDGVPVTNVLGTSQYGEYPPNSGEIALNMYGYLDPHCTCLELCHYYDFESEYDGGNVQISTDAGASWQIVHPQRGYDNPWVDPSTPCVGGQPAFGGTAGHFVRDCFDISAFVGETVWIGFHFGSNSSVERLGWYIKWLKVGSREGSPVEERSWGTIKAMYR